MHIYYSAADGQVSMLDYESECSFSDKEDILPLKKKIKKRFS